MKVHEFSELINELTKAALKYYNTQQLRERIKSILIESGVKPNDTLTKA